MTEAGDGFAPMNRLDSEAELAAELQSLRDDFLPFMEDYSPELPEKRVRMYLSEFDWRIAEADDSQNFGGVLSGQGSWETVTIPHFGPPMGRKTTYYRKQFTLSPEMLAYETQVLRFKGVDYKSKVYVNGAYVGGHEGFFAPFEFNIESYLKEGPNVLLVQVENDHTTLGSVDSEGNRAIGNKIYAAGGLGWDEPNIGWHVCPPGMGIYQDCYIESRNPLHVNDVFVRPDIEAEEVEVWLEINNFDPTEQDVKILFDVYGKNFADTIVTDLEFIPATTYIPGLGDLAKPTDWQKSRLKMGYGVNFLKFKIPIPSPRLWDNSNPWLYTLQTRVLNEAGEVTDALATPFGMRSFTQDTLSVPKGQMYLNGEKVRLRGANTMGFLQNDVRNKNWEQLIDDILLAKAANLNFIRLTQRPVQPEIYAFCDQLGMMLQTDLPIFGSMRPNLFAEGVKQAGEMERLVRNHPSNIMVTYINERFPNAEGHPHRSMSTIEEYLKFFRACDQIVHFWNPDRVIKAADGDYDPPSPDLPDNHMYNIWYNGHGLGLGALHKGYWQMVKPDWYYACGEFGSEGLDNYETMMKYWPTAWLPKDTAEAWRPDKVALAQTNDFHYMWYPTQDKLSEWIAYSQQHQAWATRWVAEAFRRDKDMVSFAIHLFIDAWPAGWMKAIMDVERKPKKAFYAYRDALAPLMVSLRTDRFHFFAGEEIKVENWLCNDLNEVAPDMNLKWQLEKDGQVLLSASTPPEVAPNEPKFQGYITFLAPEVKERTQYQLRSALFDAQGKGISESVIDVDVFPKMVADEETSVFAPLLSDKTRGILADLGISPTKQLKEAQTIVVDSFAYYQTHREKLDQAVDEGKSLVFLDLPAGDYTIGDTEVKVEKTVLGEYYFVSPTTEHPLVDFAHDFDFRIWYNEADGYIRPILGSMLWTEDAWKPILKTGRITWTETKGNYAAASEMKMGRGNIRICQLKLDHRLQSNPTARKFALRLLSTTAN